jgi:hypothetical protein
MNAVKISTLIVLIVFLFSSTILVASEKPGVPEEPGVSHLPDRIQTTFVENKGQVADNEIAFFANFLDGTVFVKKNGILSYDFLPDEKNNVLINEKFTPGKVTLIPLEPPPTDIIAIYKERGYIQADHANYYCISLGEIYKGVELELRVFTDGFDKFLIISSQGNPEMIQIKLEGIKGLKVDKSGLLELTADFGAVKLTQPYAFQLVENERKPIEISYRIVKEAVYGFNVGKYDKNKPLMIHFKTRKGEDQ